MIYNNLFNIDYFIRTSSIIMQFKVCLIKFNWVLEKSTVFNLKINIRYFKNVFINFFLELYIGDLFKKIIVQRIS